MALLLVMFILVLGYTYVSRIPSERFKLRRSNGWETYVRLGAAGLKFLLYAVVFAFVAYLAVLIPLWFADWLFGWSLASGFSRLLRTSLFLNIQIYQVILVGLAYIFCFSEVSQEDKDAWKLQTHGDVLDLVLLATGTLSPIRISCKSRKVYIGWVQLGVPEKAELDCIYIIPMFSGHRDPDTLHVILDFHYMEVYDKLNLLDNGDAAKDRSLVDFLMAVRMDEVESISLYQPEITDYFSPTPG